MQSNRTITDFLLSQTLRSVFLILAGIAGQALVIYIDVSMFGAVTGFGVLGCCLVIAACAALHAAGPMLGRRRPAEPDPLRHLRRQRGELSPVFLVVLLVLVFVWLCLAYVPSSRAEGGGLSQMLIEETARQWPRVPLSAAELSELQDLNLRLRVLAEGLTDSPADAGSGIREKRLFLKRKLESASESIVDALVAHATALVRQGGAR